MNKFLLLIDGMSGAGKTTTVGFLSTDLPRTAVVGFDKIKRFITDFKRGTKDNAISREVTLAMASRYLELGLPVIVEQSFKTKKEIQAYEELAAEHSIPCVKYQLHTDPDDALVRVVKRTKLNDGDLKESRAKRNIGLFASQEDMGFILIDTTNKSPEYASKVILKELRSLK